MPKRSVAGVERKHAKTRPQYAADFLPHPWLAEFENEAPGYIRAIPGTGRGALGKMGDLDNLYIKKAVTKTVTRTEAGPNGPISKTEVRTIYVWVRP